MAHVLLPCDLPNWAELQRQLSQVRLAQSVKQFTSDMLKVHDTCSINLDPDEIPLKGDETRFRDFEEYLTDVLNDSHRLHFFKAVLPGLVSSAQRLRVLKPVPSFQFSLQQEDGANYYERRFLASMVANAFLSTFPRRTIKTHPTLQDFSFGEFFRHLQKPTQQEKLKYIFKYFEKLSIAEPKGSIRLCRQVLSPRTKLSLPSWLCNTKTLCPLAVRAYGNIEDSEPQMIKACFCSKRIGGNVLLGGDNQESLIFCRMPELLSLLCFVEALDDNEALFVEGVTVTGKSGDSILSFIEGEREADVILLDAWDFSDNPIRQYEDAFLLRELTKLLAAFGQHQSRRRPSPVGESSSSSTCPERGSPATGTTGDSSQGSSRRSSDQSVEGIKSYAKLPPSGSSDDRKHSASSKFSGTLSSLARVTEKLPTFGLPSPVKSDQNKVSRSTLPVVPQPPPSSAKPRSNSAPVASKLANLTTQLAKNSTSNVVKSEEKPPQSTVISRSSLIGGSIPQPPLSPFGKKERITSVKRDLSHGSTGKTTKLPKSSAENIKNMQKEVTRDSTSTPRLPPVSLPIQKSSSASQNSPTVKTPRRRIKSQPSGEDEYYTADESMDECEEVWFIPGLNLPAVHKERLDKPIELPRLSPYKVTPVSEPKKKSKRPSGKSRSRSNPTSEEEFFLDKQPAWRRLGSSSRTSAESSGFALGDYSDADDDSLNLSVYEKYEDFRRRFRRRSRAGLSRRSRSRHSRPSSSGSSEMDDIVEDPEYGFGGSGFPAWGMRSASSEPSLVQATPAEEAMVANLLAVPPDAIVCARRGRKLVMTTGDGQLKAYSYDGVHPNLPVPFKANFRRRRNSEGGNLEEAVCNLQTEGKYFYSYANAAFWRKVEAEARSGVTSPASSSQDASEDSERSKGSSHKSRPSSEEEEESGLLEDDEEKYYNLLLPSAEGLRPVATGRWGCGRQKGDPQLKAVLQWLAASVAGLPYLIFYTKGDPCLEKMERLSKVAEAKQWTVGDLACETLRYSRNRMALQNSGQNPNTFPFLFTFLMGNYLLQPHDSLE